MSQAVSGLGTQMLESKNTPPNRRAAKFSSPLSIFFFSTRAVTIPDCVPNKILRLLRPFLPNWLQRIQRELGNLVSKRGWWRLEDVFFRFNNHPLPCCVANLTAMCRAARIDLVCDFEWLSAGFTLFVLRKTIAVEIW